MDRILLGEAQGFLLFSQITSESEKPQGDTVSEGLSNGPPTCPLRPIILNNACPPRITAAAGTEFAGTFPSISVKISG